MAEERKNVLQGDDLVRVITRMAHEIVEKAPTTSEVVLIGIRSRGVHLARRLARKLQETAHVAPPVGERHARVGTLGARARDPDGPRRARGHPGAHSARSAEVAASPMPKRPAPGRSLLAWAAGGLLVAACNGPIESRSEDTP